MTEGASVSPSGAPQLVLARGRHGAGPTVIFDIDGVLSDAAGRQHFLEWGRRDWDAFFDACGDDPLVGEVARLLELLDSTLRIVFSRGAPCGCSPRPWPGWPTTGCDGTCS